MQVIVDGIHVDIERGTSGAYFATSPDMRGLQVAGMTMADVERTLPEAISEMRAAQQRAYDVATRPFHRPYG